MRAHTQHCMVLKNLLIMHQEDWQFSYEFTLIFDLHHSITGRPTLAIAHYRHGCIGSTVCIRVLHACKMHASLFMLQRVVSSCLYRARSSQAGPPGRVL
jgi:hypothetical protein